MITPADVIRERHRYFIEMTNTLVAQLERALSYWGGHDGKDSTSICLINLDIGRNNGEIAEPILTAAIREFENHGWHVQIKGQGSHTYFVFSLNGIKSEA